MGNGNIEPEGSSLVQLTPEDLFRKAGRLLNSLESNYELLRQQSGVGGGGLQEQITKLRVDFGVMAGVVKVLDGINLGLIKQDVLNLKIENEKRDARRWQLLVLVLGQVVTVAGLILTWIYKH